MLSSGLTAGKNCRCDVIFRLNSSPNPGTLTIMDKIASKQHVCNVMWQKNKLCVWKWVPSPRCLIMEAQITVSIWEHVDQLVQGGWQLRGWLGPWESTLYHTIPYRTVPYHTIPHIYPHSSIPGTYGVEGEKQVPKLFSDLHTCAVVHMCYGVPHTHTNKYIKKTLSKGIE